MRKDVSTERCGLRPHCEGTISQRFEVALTGRAVGSAHPAIVSVLATTAAATTCTRASGTRRCTLWEEVVVAGGGLVLADHCERIETERAKVMDAAADALAIAAAVVFLAALGAV